MGTPSLPPRGTSATRSLLASLLLGAALLSACSAADPSSPADPGASAASVTIALTGVLMAPGGTRTLTATVLTAAGAVVSVPLSWGSGSGGVATVSTAGVVTGAGEGATQITATTPNGLSASAWAYVVNGEVAFVQGGHVRSRAVGGGALSDLTPGASSASNPSFGPGGTTLAWVDGSSVYVGSSRVTDGHFPSISPDGRKLAVERSGTVWFTNIDGSNATQGPAGTSPVWMGDGAHLAVGGGGVQRVKADGTERSTLASGAARLPALAAGGQLAFISGDTLQIAGRGTVLTGATGRAAWSPGARWLVVPTGSDLMLVDAVGSAPAIGLGVGSASDPTWRGAAASGASTPPSVGSLDPVRPVPGAELNLVGLGFDWIIPGNNRVFFPSASGPVQGEVRTVTDTRLTTVMPRGTTPGSIRLVTNAGESSIAVVPSLGSIRVRVRMEGDVPAPGQHVIVRRGATIDVAGEGDTNADGRVSFDLAAGDYTIELQPASGFQVFSDATVPVHVAFEPTDVVFDVGVLPVRVTLDPASPLSLEVGTTVRVRAHAFDIRGNEITTFRSIRWTGSARIQVDGSLDAVVAGVAASATAGDGVFSLSLDGKAFDFASTVTSFVSGTVTQIPDGGGTATPVSGVSVVARDQSGRATNATTNAAGAYRVSGLLGGTYLLSVNAPSGYATAPTTRSVTLGPGASGQDFQLARFYIEGTVTDGGAPASGVTMELYPSGSANPVGPTVTTGPDGKYRFAANEQIGVGVPASGTYDVKGVASGKVLNPAARTVTLDGSHPSASGQDFTLLATSITGTVRKRGVGVANARVVLEVASTARLVATTMTAPDGSYVFNAVGPGSFDISPNGVGSPCACSPLVRTVTIASGTPSATGQDFDLIVTYIEGTITENGSPSSGLTVGLFNARDVEPFRTTVTNASGFYRFEEMGLGDQFGFAVRPTVPPGKTVTPTSRTVILTPSAPTASGQNFTLSAPD